MGDILVKPCVIILFNQSGSLFISAIRPPCLVLYCPLLLGINSNAVSAAMDGLINVSNTDIIIVVAALP